MFNGDVFSILEVDVRNNIKVCIECEHCDEEEGICFSPDLCETSPVSGNIIGKTCLFIRDINTECKYYKEKINIFRKLINWITQGGTLR